MNDPTGPCRGHRWQPWVWARVQFPTGGLPLESVWERACAHCYVREMRRTSPTRRPVDDDLEVRGPLLRGEPESCMPGPLPA